MVTLQSRWKQNRSWNVKLYVGLLVAVVLCAALVVAVKGLIVWLKDVVVPAATAPIVSAPEEKGASDQYVGRMVGQFEREFRVSDYTFILPNDFEAEVMPQPGDIPRGGRFTGLRFRVGRDDAVQLCLMIIDYPKEVDEEAEPEVETHLSEALDRLFTRLSRNAAMIGLTRGETQYGDLDGMPFARCRFSGDFRNGRRASRVRCSCAAVATAEKRRDVFLYSLCDDTTHPDDRELLETSLLTLRRIDLPREAAESPPSKSPGGD
ncbi:MAG TPA: hypothetical protein VG826_13810 [Pirellulales bacterium]|nr:hypothetical protein [Pirellulales bacterium]